MNNFPTQVYPPNQSMNQLPNYNNAQMNYQPDGFDPSLQQQQQMGFGQMFFNMNDPNIAKTNVPIKQDASNHIQIIIVTVVLIAGVVVGAVGFRVFLPDYGSGILIGCSYLIYILVVIFGSDIRGYITNLKRFDEYKQIYDSMVAAKGFFIFWIQCYHYRTVRTKNGTRRQKVVTHTATERYNPVLSEDTSGSIVGIEDITKYVFINYLKKFYFVNQNSEAAFNRAYNAFIQKNKRDQYQNYSNTFDIDGFQEEVGFCALGEGGHNSFLFYFTSFLGLAFPYSCILERSVSRYSINIVKRLTCQ